VFVSFGRKRIGKKVGGRSTNTNGGCNSGSGGGSLCGMLLLIVVAVEIMLRLPISKECLSFLPPSRPHLPHLFSFSSPLPPPSLSREIDEVACKALVIAGYIDLCPFSPVGILVIFADVGCLPCF